MKAVRSKKPASSRRIMASGFFSDSSPLMPGPLMVSKPSSFAKTTEVEIASKAMTRIRNKICRWVLFISKLLLVKSGYHYGISINGTPPEVYRFPLIYWHILCRTSRRFDWRNDVLQETCGTVYLLIYGNNLV